MDKQIKEFLRECINCKNWGDNPILQDWITPKLFEKIEIELDKDD